MNVLRPLRIATILAVAWAALPSYAQDELRAGMAQTRNFKPSFPWQRALEASRLRIDDLSFAEVHDCFTIAELLSYEAMGLVPKGQGERAILEGWTTRQGKLPVNPSGGLKAKGHPIGATGVSMHVMAALQLVGEAGDFQVGGAKLGGVFNMGGSAVANYVSILDPVRA